MSAAETSLIKAAKYLTNRSWYFGAPAGVYELRRALFYYLAEGPKREAEAALIQAAMTVKHVHDLLDVPDSDDLVDAPCKLCEARRRLQEVPGG